MATLVVIGMRGAGKSSLGAAGAKALGWKFVDMDEALEEREGKSCGDLVGELGWEGFRKVELQALEHVLANNPKETVVSCGGGIVETEPARDVLLAYQGPIIFIDRYIDDIVSYLSAKELVQQEASHKEKVSSPDSSGDGEDAVSSAELLSRRPKYGESVEDVYQRRRPFFDLCCTHIFSIAPGDMDFVQMSREFESMVLSIYITPTPSVLSANCFVCEPGSRSQGMDALLLPAIELGQLASVRRQASLPIILDCGSEANHVSQGLQHGVTAVKVDSLAIMEEALQTLPKWQGTTRVVLNLCFDSHDLASPTSIQKQVQDALKLLPSLKRVVVGCIALHNTELDSCLTVTRVLCAIDAETQGEVTIAVSASVYGKAAGFARKLCRDSFGPQFVGGLLDKGGVETADKAFEFSETEHYCLFGHPIQASPSPAMHNAGFTKLGLPKMYTLCDTLDEHRLATVIASHRFRGASVTIPHKEVVHKYLDELSEAATAIGAVNTVIKDSSGKLLGDNTDWFGIYNLIREPVRGRNLGESRGVGLVVGAGGTALSGAYCISQLGLDLYVYNRTVEKAEKVANRFNGQVVRDLGTLERVDVIIGTVPAASGFEMPTTELLSTFKPVVVDAAYRPRRTKLLQQAASCGCETFEGIDMLIEQGLRQMELWTGQEAPRTEMAGAARTFYDASA